MRDLTRRFPLACFAFALVVFASTAFAAPDFASDHQAPTAQDLALEGETVVQEEIAVDHASHLSVFGETPIVFASSSTCLQDCRDDCTAAYQACVGTCGTPGSPGYFQCYFQCEQDADFCYDCCHLVHCS